MILLVDPKKKRRNRPLGRVTELSERPDMNTISLQIAWFRNMHDHYVSQALMRQIHGFNTEAVRVERSARALRNEFESVCAREWRWELLECLWKKLTKNFFISIHSTRPQVKGASSYQAWIHFLIFFFNKIQCISTNSFSRRAITISNHFSTYLGWSTPMPSFDSTWFCITWPSASRPPTNPKSPGDRNQPLTETQNRTLWSDRWTTPL